MDLKDLVPVFIVSIVFVASVAVVATIAYFLHRSKELKHQTIRHALEKGLPLPPDLFSRPRDPRGDLRNGVKLVFAGLGVSGFLWFTHPHLWSAGLIPGFIGLGYLAAHALAGRGAPDARSAQ